MIPAMRSSRGWRPAVKATGDGGEDGNIHGEVYVVELSGRLVFDGDEIVPKVMIFAVNWSHFGA